VIFGRGLSFSRRSGLVAVLEPPTQVAFEMAVGREEFALDPGGIGHRAPHPGSQLAERDAPFPPDAAHDLPEGLLRDRVVLLDSASASGVGSSLPAALPPLAEVRTLGADGRVVAVAGVDRGLIG
jgi:hypothetical protein